jgi:hypothetical protein
MSNCNYYYGGIADKAIEKVYLQDINRQYQHIFQRDGMKFLCFEYERSPINYGYRIFALMEGIGEQ